MRKLLSLKLLSEKASKTFTSSLSTPHSHSHSHSHIYRHFHTLSKPKPITDPTILSSYLLCRSFGSHFRNFVGPSSRLGFLKTQVKPPWSSYSSTPSPRRAWSSWSRGYSADGVVYGLIIANAAVFVLWRVLPRDFMYENFTISLDNFKSGRIHTLLTCAFSHVDIEHLGSNMIGLYFFGSSIGSVFGPEYLLKLYIAGAVVGSIFFLAHHAYLAITHKNQGTFYKNPSKIPGLGASGAVNAILLLDIFLFPRKTLLFDFFIPVPAILLGIFLVGKDVLRMIEGDQQISGSAHLGGAVVAAVAWLHLRRKLRF